MSLKSVHGFKNVSDTGDFAGMAHAAASSETCCPNLVFCFASPEEET